MYFHETLFLETIIEMVNSVNNFPPDWEVHLRKQREYRYWLMLLTCITIGVSGVSFLLLHYSTRIGLIDAEILVARATLSLPLFLVGIQWCRILLNNRSMRMNRV